MPTSSEEDNLEDRHVRIGFGSLANPTDVRSWPRRSLSNGMAGSPNGLEMRPIARPPSEPIRLSIPLWPRASDQDRRETVIHEACHLIAFYKHGLVPLLTAPSGRGDEELRYRTVEAPYR